MKCSWCSKQRRVMSSWEQRTIRDEWKRLCEPCARRRLSNPFNALLEMRRVDDGQSVPAPEGAAK